MRPSRRRERGSGAQGKVRDPPQVLAGSPIHQLAVALPPVFQGEAARGRRRES